LTRRSWLLLAGNIAAAGLLVYCAAPLPTEAPPAPPPRALPSTPVAAGVTSAVPVHADVAAERFTPFTALPAFAKVADALEERDSKRALDELELLEKTSPPSLEDAPRLALLAGLVAERAGEPGRALLAFERAERPSYVLFGHARAGKARVLAALGRPLEALGAARGIPDEPSLAGQKRLATARAAWSAGERATALAAYRSHLAVVGRGSERWATALGLASALLDPRPTPARERVPDVLEALSLVRRVAAEAPPSSEPAAQARALETELLAALPIALRSAHSRPSVEDGLVRVEAALEARRFKDALVAAEETRASAGTALEAASACRLELARAKAFSGQRDPGKALATVSELFDRCKPYGDLHARALFNAGKYAASDARYLEAASLYARVETEHRDNTLADDARLGAALAYLEAGVEARFTELVSAMPDDFPGGDMVAEGLFRLALRRMDRGDWSGAVSVLERAVKIVDGRDAERGGELAGRELYFLARGELKLGQRDRALERLERVVSELPLSYYMLHAHARLLGLDEPRARRARELALERARGDGRPRVPERLLEEPGTVRALELLRVGETESAVTELEALGLLGPSAAPELLWAVARTYVRAGADKLAHDVVRQRLTDWLTRWPAGDWLEAWRAAFPVPYRSLVESVASRQGLEPALVFAVMREESAFDPEAASSADAYGLMQLILPTARVAAKGTNLPHDRRALFRPRVNVELGCRTLARYQKAFPENPLLGIPAYNAGPNRARAWLTARPSADFDLWVELIPFVETRRYTKRVLSSRAAYTFLYTKESPERILGLPERVQAPK
jgi:soluble lytic murein transglycosylase